ncbi:MAG: uridylate kinase [Methylotenera sp.]
MVKLGGSLIQSPELKNWLDTLVKISDGKLLIVPGGSVFADAVRDAQQYAQVSDATAHQLALLAMDQYGLLLAGMNSLLVTASSELEIAERGWQHRAIVWLPSQMVLADEHIPQNWQVTSDSLSAWIAEKINAEHLVIVKSADLSAYQNTLKTETLVEAQVLDQAFPEFVTDCSFKCWLLNKRQHAVFASGLDEANLRIHAHQIMT